MSQALKELSELLVNEIPLEVQSIKSKSRICCIRLYYYDTHAPCGYITLRILLEKDRDRVFEDHENAIYKFWATEEWFGRGPEIDVGGEGKDEYRVEELLAETHPTKTTDAGMKRFRNAMARVCKQLNSIDWSEFAKVTDDFVIAIADGSRTYCDEWADLKASIPAAKLKVLHGKQLLGVGDYWDILEDDIYENGDDESTSEAAEDRILSMSQSKRFKHCTGAINLYTHGKTPEEDFGCDFYLDFLKSKEGVAALLQDVVLKNMATEIQLGGGPDPVRDSLWLIAEHDFRSKKIERLLLDFVRKSYAANKKSKHASTHTVHAANCLFKLFKGYPDPEMNENNNRLDNFAEFDAK